MAMFHATQYNALPTVDDAHVKAGALQGIRDELLKVIVDYKLVGLFGVRLIHKHFDLNPDEVAVFRREEIPGICMAYIMGPVKVEKAVSSAVKGKHFLVGGDGRLVPYEFSTSAGLDIALYPDFARDVSRVLVEANATRVFGIVAFPVEHDRECTEIEIPELRSTVTIPQTFVPKEDDTVDILTIWASDGEGSAPEPYDNCMITRAQKHHPLYCRKTRSGNHVNHRLGAITYGTRGGQADGSAAVMEPSPAYLADPLSRIFDHVEQVIVAAY